MVSQPIPETVLVFSLSSSCDNSQPSQSCPASQSRSDLTLDSLKSMLSDLDTGSFCHVKSSKYVTFVRLSDELVPTVRISLVVDVDCVVHIAVLEKPLSKHHPLWQHVPNVVKSKDDVVLLLDVLSQGNICSGAGDPKLFNRHVLKNTSSCVEQQSGCVRSTSCELLLLHADRCLPCCRLKKQLQQRKRRQLRRTATSSNFPNQFFSSPFTRTKLTHLARMARLLKRKNKSLQVRLERCKRMCRNMVKTHGEKLTHSDSQNMIQLATECTDTALKQFPPGSFQEVFWKQQLQYNQLKNKSNMRWHPTMIRWCLYLKSKSAKAYEGVRSYLSLPSTRTLYDYSHYMEHRLGVNPKVVEQLINSASKMGCYEKKHCGYVGILHDEIKIKSDLVYNKSTGELIGYVRLDDVTNELLKLGDHSKNEMPVAQNLLVTMVRGITTSLKYPFAAYATSSLSGSTLYNIIWECIEYIEVVAGLKVLFICCDGAAQNRKFISLHADGSEFVYKTKNFYAADNRDIYFVSDPPHLLKTARNCLPTLLHTVTVDICGLKRTLAGLIWKSYLKRNAANQNIAFVQN